MLIIGIDLESGISKQIFDNLLKLLPEEKQRRILKFIREEDAQTCLLADILQRYMIAEKIGIELAQIVFDTNPYGKPLVKNQPGIYINASHSGKRVVAVIDDCVVGIDVEEVKAYMPDIAKRFFSKYEYNMLLSKDLEKRKEFFFELWTLKESYIKAVGKGLSIPLESFTINFSEDKIFVETENQFNNFYLKQYDIGRGYKMAVCSKKKEFPLKANNLNVGEFLAMIKEKTPY